MKGIYMNRVQLIIAIRQLCETSISKIDTMVRPDVVIREFNLSKDNLKNQVNETICSFRDKTEMYCILAEAGGFINSQRRNSEFLRNKMKRIQANLPSAIR